MNKVLLAYIGVYVFTDCRPTLQSRCLWSGTWSKVPRNGQPLKEHIYYLFIKLHRIFIKKTLTSDLLNVLNKVWCTFIQNSKMENNFSSNIFYNFCHNIETECITLSAYKRHKRAFHRKLTFFILLYETERNWNLVKVT